jgi:hypothetical protein
MSLSTLKSYRMPARERSLAAWGGKLGAAEVQGRKCQEVPIRPPLRMILRGKALLFGAHDVRLARSA